MGVSTPSGTVSTRTTSIFIPASRARSCSNFSRFSRLLTGREIKLNRASPKKLYEYLTKFVIQTTKSINENSNSAIYIIDPQKNNFTIQNGNTSEFVDSISLTNQIVKKHLTNKKKFHQKS